MSIKKALGVSLFVISVLVTLVLNGNAAESTAAQDDSELAKQTQNPVADLISVPFQNNWNFGAGPRPDT